MATSRPKIKNIIPARRWDVIKGAWLKDIPEFDKPGAKPDPGLDHLAPLQQITLPADKGRSPDVAGLRRNMLAEAVFLFHKCAHTHLAAQRLGSLGMHSWAMFNAYHSAYFGAKGVLALFGIGLTTIAPESGGGQFMIDIFPQPELSTGKKKRLSLGEQTFDEFVVVRFGRPLDHSETWEAFQRVLNASDVACWDKRTYDELRLVSHKAIAKPRNSILYRVGNWPGDDLLVDGTEAVFAGLAGTDLEGDQAGFLLRLSYDVYWLFEQAITDLASTSSAIRDEIDGSRIIRSPSAPALAAYSAFLGGIAAPSPAESS